MKNVAWTSLEAYDAIFPHIGAAQQGTLSALIAYRELHASDPTSRELMRFCQDDEGSQRRARLFELADRHAVHRGQHRRCTVSGHAAATWILGPHKGEDLVVEPAPKLKPVDKTTRIELFKALEETRDSLNALVMELGKDSLFNSGSLDMLRGSVTKIDRILERERV